MEVDIYFESIFWLRHRTLQKMQKPAAKNCFFVAENHEPH